MKPLFLGQLLSFDVAQRSRLCNRYKSSLNAMLLLSLGSLTACGSGGGTAPDTTAPVITLAGDASVTLINSESYSEQGASATDNVDDTVAVVISGEVEATPDTYSVTYTATDSANNTSSVIRTVIVQDDILPDTFTLTDSNDAFLNTQVESAPITVSGINRAVAVSVVGGEYSIDGGAFSSSDTTVIAGQIIKVRATSAAALNEQAQASLSIGSGDSTFAITTRTAEPSGIFNGAGSVNEGTSLGDVKGIIQNEHFMLFNEAENVLYDGNILTYSGDGFTATVDVYKDGVNSQTVNATGTIVNQTSISVTLAGTGYGKGVIDLAYNALFERGATMARFSVPYPNVWGGVTNTVNSGQSIGLRDIVDSNVFTGGPIGEHNCGYNNGLKTIPNMENNLYLLSFDAERVGASDTCDHKGDSYQGLATIVDGGARLPDGTDGIMWFAASNGLNSTFTVFEHITYK